MVSRCFYTTLYNILRIQFWRIFFYPTLYNVLHQKFYTSWEIFTRAALAPLAPFSTSVADGADFYAPDVAPDCILNNPVFQNQLTQLMGTVFDSSCTEYAANNSIDNVAALCGVTAR